MFGITSDLEILESTENPEEYSEKFDCFKKYEIFKNALSQLSETHQDVILNRYTEKKSTLVELSKKHKISVEKIRQLESESISIMKNWISKNFNSDLQYI